MTGWQDDADCRGLTGLFFPTKGDDTTWNAAKKVCATCPVRVDCLNHALTEPENFGVWGGTTADERKSMRRRRATVVHLTDRILDNYRTTLADPDIPMEGTAWH